jgi:hypothetical protein
MKPAVLAVALLSLIACSKSNLSERDSKLQQMKSSAEIKRRELKVVEGAYDGVMTQNSGPERYPTLRLEIKDIPTYVEGSIDPVMVPILTGFLCFELGGQSFISFSIEKADFDPKTGKLDIVANNPDYNDIVFSLRYKSPNVDGTWLAKSSSTSGEAHLKRTTTPISPVPSELKGDYFGVMTREKDGLFQFAQLTLNTVNKPPQGVKVSGVLRLIFGDLNSTEYLTYSYDPVEFNPMTGQLVFKAEGSAVTVTGNWSKEEFKGEWSSSFTGRLGTVEFRKGVPPAAPAGKIAVALKGSYQGTFKNTNPHSNLPERIMMSFVTAQDLTKPNGVSVTGALRFYMGPFGSLEYVEYPFADVQYNFFTQELVARVDGEYKLSLKAHADPTKAVAKITGKMDASALGEVGSFVVEKQ